MNNLRSEGGEFTCRDRAFAALIQSAPVAMVVVGAGGTMEQFNAEAARLFGYAPGEVLAQAVTVLMTEGSRKSLESHIADFLAAPEAWSAGRRGELAARRQDGSEFAVELGLSPIEVGEGAGVLCTFLDISARRAAERALQENEERFLTVAENMSQLAWMADEAGNIFWCNPRWQEYTGNNAEEMQGEGWRKVFHPDHVDRVADLFRRCKETGEVWEDTVPLRGKDGRYRWFLSRALPIRDGAGKLVRWFGSCTDVTEQKQAEEALRRSEAILNAVLDTLPVGVIIADLNGAIVRANAATRELWGIPPDTTTWKDFNDWVAWWPATGERIQAQDWALTRALMYGEVTRDQLVQNQRFQSEERRYFLNNVAPLRNAGGRIVGAVAAMLDVTERRSATEALTESERRLSTLVANLPGMAYRCANAPQWPMEFLSERAFDLTGYPAQDFCSGRLNYGDVVLPEDREMVWQGVQNGLDARKPFTLEYRIRHADGSERWVWEQGRGVFDEGGNLVALEGFIVETTERRRAQEKLRESEERFRGTFETAAVGIAHVAPGGRWLRVNRKLCEIVGYPWDELQTKTFGELTHPEDIEADALQAQRLLSGEVASYSLDMRCIHREGKVIWVALNMSLMRHSDGTPDYFIAVFRDITTRKRLEQNLQELSADLSRQVQERTQDLSKALDAAETANRAKSEFLANMSHEIRTPMNGVLGMTELLLQTPLSSEQRHYLELVRQSADALLVLINDILDFSKIEAGKLELFPVAFDLRETLGATLQSLGHRAGEKGLELAYRVAPEIPACVIGDAGRLRQIVVNLVGNAVKFTTQGEILAEVNLQSREGEHATLHFQVRDTGCGIPAEKLEVVFAPFNQGDNSSQRRYGGTGLGLSICRQLVELMDGRIWLESVEGEGTSVHFTVRLEVCEQDIAFKEPSPESLRGLRVVVADDNDTTRLILEEMLQSWGMQPLMAKDGAELLRLLDSAQSAEAPVRLILLDMILTDMDGEAVAREVRQRWKANAPGILVMASLGQHIPVRKLHDLGINRVLTKPVRASQLLDAIVQQLGSADGEEREAEPVPSRPTVHPLRILLAEDNSINRMVAVKLLEERGHSVVAVDDGARVLHALEEESFDAVLMDVQMPEMDGLTAAREIRIRERKAGRSRIPIIALTADAMATDRERCLQAGMDGYVAKPVRSSELYDALERTPLTPADPPPPKPQEVSISAFDPDYFVAAMGDLGLVREMIKAFQEDAERWIQVGESALEQGDAEGLHRVAHSLKGMIGNFTTAEPFLRVSELNELTRKSPLAPQAARLFSIAKEQVRGLQAELEKLAGSLQDS